MTDLVEQIDALLALNAKGAVSHQVPGLAVELLERAKVELSLRQSHSTGVVVKGLEWVFGQRTAEARVPFGEYQIAEYTEQDGMGYVVCFNDNDEIGEFATSDEAVKAAQADYEQRIRSALLHKGEGEPVAWRVRERPGFDWRFVDGDPDRDPHLAGFEKQPLYASPAPLPVGVTPPVREVMWAEVVFEGEDNRFLWACDEEGNMDGVHHEMSIELSADNFPVGTKLTISEPAALSKPGEQG